MPKIVITDQTHRLIQAAAERPFKNTAKRLPDGRWEVPIEQSTLERINEVRLAGETIDGVLERIIHTQKGLN